MAEGTMHRVDVWRTDYYCDFEYTTTSNGIENKCGQTVQYTGRKSENANGEELFFHKCRYDHRTLLSKKYPVMEDIPHAEQPTSFQYIGSISDSYKITSLVWRVCTASVIVWENGDKKIDHTACTYDSPLHVISLNHVHHLVTAGTP